MWNCDSMELYTFLICSLDFIFIIRACIICARFWERVLALDLKIILPLIWSDSRGMANWCEDAMQWNSSLSSYAMHEFFKEYHLLITRQYKINKKICHLFKWPDHCKRSCRVLLKIALDHVLTPPKFKVLVKIQILGKIPRYF